MRKSLIFIFIFLFCSTSLACTPCVKDTIAIVKSQALPKFSKTSEFIENNGRVTFTVDIIRPNKIENINILNIEPKSISKSVVLEMINHSHFLLIASPTKDAIFPCSLKAQEFVFEFLLPKKVNIDLEF